MPCLRYIVLTVCHTFFLLFILFGYVMKRASSRCANLNLTLDIVLGSASLVAFMSVDADIFKVCFP